MQLCTRLSLRGGKRGQGGSSWGAKVSALSVEKEGVGAPNVEMTSSQSQDLVVPERP